MVRTELLAHPLQAALGEPLAHTPVSMQIAGNPDKWVGSTPPGWMEVKNISVHHNLFHSNHHRNPNTGAQGIEVINNVMSNMGRDAGKAVNGAKILIAGVAYMFTGYIVSHLYAGQDGRMFAMQWTPALFLLAERAIARRRLHWFGWLAVVVVLQVFTPHVQMMYFAGMGVGVFVLWRLTMQM